MIKKLLGQKSHNSFIQFFRYIFVGGLAALINIGLYTLLRYFIVFFYNYFIVASIISTICGLIVNYVLSLIWIFPHRNIKNKSIEFIIFALIGVVGIGIEQLLLLLFNLLIKRITGVRFYVIIIPKLFSIGLVFLWNFFVRKFILFNPNMEGKNEQRQNK